MNQSLIVIKIGTHVLTTSHYQLDLNQLRNIVTQITHCKNNSQYHVVLVTSGAITCGSEHLGYPAETLEQKQAAAAVGQILLMKEYGQFFMQERLSIAQILLTKDGLTDDQRRHNAKKTIMTLLEQGIIPIINENDSVATDEIPTSDNDYFGDNDLLASKVAQLLDAAKLIILTDIDGLYSSNPKSSDDAVLIPELSEITDDIFEYVNDPSHHISRGGMKSKLLAAKSASEVGIDVHIVNGHNSQIIQSLLKGESHGTYIKGQKS